MTIKNNILLDKAGDITIRAYKNVNIKSGKNINITSENGSYSVEAEHAAKMETHMEDITIGSDKGKCY